MKGKLIIGLLVLVGACAEEAIMSFEQQKKIDVAKIDQYLLDHGITNAIADASGIRMVITAIGTQGLPPNMGNDIKVVYSGKLFSGYIFDNGDTPALGKLGEFIRGWQIALQMLPEGSIATLYIPSVYGYGEQGASGIPSNSNLIFYVDLENVEPQQAQIDKLASDGTAIDEYLTTKGWAETTTTDPSGLRYEIINEGTGTSYPELYDQIKVKITGKIIPSEFELGSGEVEPSTANSCRVINFAPGMHIGIPKIKEGGKIKLYIPSVLGYGNVAQPNIPANSNLFFEVELLDIIE